MRPVRFSALLLFGALSTAPAVAQDVPTWRAQLDLRIDANTHDLSPIGWISIAPNGSIVFAQPQDTLLRYFDVRGRSIGTFGRGGAGPGEFRIMVAHGWIGDTLWVSDPVLRRVTFISPDRKLLRTVMQLSTIRLPDARADTAMFAWIFPQALFTDGTAWVTPMRGRNAPRPPWPGGDSARVQVLHLRNDGTFIRVLATHPDNPCSIVYQIPGGYGSVGTPYCGSPVYDLSNEAARYVIASTIEQSARVARYRVTVVRASGDTAFNRVYERPGRPIPRRVADSTLAAYRRQAMFPHQDEAYDRAKIPDGYPPYARILAGRDGTTWIEEYVPPHERRQRRWLVLDERGTPIGRISIPASIYIMVASRSTIWGTDSDEDGLAHIVRYRIAR